MDKYTKAQVADFTLQLIPDNNENLIEPEHVRDAFAYHRDMERLASYVKFVNTVFGFQTADEALQFLTQNNIPVWTAQSWPSGYFVYYNGNLYRSNQSVSSEDPNPATSGKWDQFGAMTGDEIVTALGALGGTNRLPKNSIWGADFSLNFRDEADVFAPSYQTINMIHIKKGDFWIYSPSGSPENYNDGDWIVAMVDNPPTPFDFSNSSYWKVLPFGSISGSITASQIIGLLEGISTIADMLNSTKIKYNDSTTVKTKIDNIETTLNGKQDQITRMRTIFSGDGSSYQLTVPGVYLDIQSFRVNRVDYEGVFGSSFDGWDFKYEHTGSDTLITLNPGLGFQFNTNDIIDIKYTEYIIVE